MKTVQNIHSTHILVCARWLVCNCACVCVCVSCKVTHRNHVTKSKFIIFCLCWSLSPVDDDDALTDANVWIVVKRLGECEENQYKHKYCWRHCRILRFANWCVRARPRSVNRNRCGYCERVANTLIYCNWFYFRFVFFLLLLHWNCELSDPNCRPSIHPSHGFWLLALDDSSEPEIFFICDFIGNFIPSLLIVFFSFYRLLPTCSSVGCAVLRFYLFIYFISCTYMSCTMFGV